MFWRQVKNALHLAVRRSALAPILRDWWNPKPLQAAIVRGRRRSWDEAAAWLLSREGESALDESGFHSAARVTINTNIELELLLTALRRTLLLQGGQPLDRPATIELLCSLVQQVINNEHVWYHQADECGALERHYRLISEGTSNGTLPWKSLALAALYSGLDELFGDPDTARQGMARATGMPAPLRELLAAHIAEWATETARKGQIPRFSTISDAVSQRVATHYERYPYPRWLDWEFDPPGARILHLKKFFKPAELDFLDCPFDVLVAGCGTGSKAIQYAIAYGPQARVLAIDLSCASLAYASRMANQRGVGNIEFLQMDLLELPRLDRSFDIVECTGVLHHLQDPLQGGRAVISRVRAGGVVHISLYSELARRGLVRVRRDYGLSPEMSDDEVRAFRYRLLVERPDIVNKDLGLRWDFFDLSRCRDLLFHPLEHRFTLPQVADYLNALKLQFRGLERPGIVRDQFWTFFPSDKDGPPSLQRWHIFEQTSPDAFRSLYEIWARKPE